MRNACGIALLIGLSLLIGPAAASDKKKTSRVASPVRQTSFSAERVDRGIESSIRRPSGPRTASRADVPLLLAPALADQAEPVPPVPAPAPANAPAPVPTPDPGHGHADFRPGPPIPLEGASVSLLYPHVCYKDLDNIAPCAVPMIVSVPDPCRECGCVFVKICVPPNCPPKIVCKHFGRGLKYQFGDYQVELKPRRDGTIDVDYDD